MLKKFLLSSTLLFAFPSGVLAGDTVTVTAPGGATQTISASVASAAITQAIASGAVTSVTQATPGGSYTVVVGGVAYVVTSSFIAKLLAFYS